MLLLSLHVAVQLMAEGRNRKGGELAENKAHVTEGVALLRFDRLSLLLNFVPSVDFPALDFPRSIV
jgi:hypothetical protein